MEPGPGFLRPLDGFSLLSDLGQPALFSFFALETP